MRYLIYIITTLILVLLVNNSYAQTYNMPANGYLEIHSDSGTIYDDGGPTGNYSTRVNSVVTIYPSTPGGLVCLQGSYDIEDWMYSFVRVYDGDTNSTWEIWNGYWSNSNFNVLSVSGPLTIRFFADTENPRTGFQFNFSVNVLNATNQTNSITNNNTATITWNGTTTDHWIVHLRFADQNWFQTTNSNSVVFDSLPYSCIWYEYLVYEPKDTNNLNCLRYNSFPISPTFSVSNVQYERKCDTLIVRWDESDTSVNWKVNFYNYATIEPQPAGWYGNHWVTGYTDTNYIQLIISRSSGDYFNNIEGYDYTDGIVIEGKKGNETNNYCWLYDQRIDPVCCCPRPNNLYISDLQSDYATITWDADTNASGFIVEYKDYKYPDDSIKYITVNTNSVTLLNLAPTTRYNVRVHSLCDSLIYKCSSKIDLITSIRGIDNCFSFTNLRDTNFAPYTGNYINPNQYFGLIDYGYWDQRSRHTVHYDTSEVDPRTDSLLHTVPPGEEASVRLGNWLPGGEGESFTYAYDVDTNVFDLMYLRYAVVMENPGHTMTNQPRFTLEILNENDSLIDPVCGYADFYASDSLGWHSVPGTVTIWKDWTLVGFDITPYHGQRILVRLTTRDCDEGGHFGYAYYHLKCGSKNLISSKCGLVDSNTFIAPIGFNYRWYSSADTSITLSTERRLDAVVDSTLNYHCLVSSTENSTCTFLYTAYGGYRYPLSLLDYTYTWQPCSFTVNFNNLSTISANGITPAGTGERCESTKWIFEDGDTITTLNAAKTFSDTSEIKVRLVSGIANDQCISILDTVLKLERPYPNLSIMGDSILCKNDTAVLYVNHSGISYWSNQDTTSKISFVPLIDTIYSLELIDSLGCYNIDSINIIVNPRDTTYITAEICDNETYTLNGFNTNIAGRHELNLLSQFNCDSTVYLNLIVNPTYNDTIYAEICNGSVYDSNGFNDSIAGFYTLQLQTLKGCDSIVNLNLIVHPTYNDTIFAYVCEGEVYSSYGFNERVTGFYTQNLQTIMGCDSIVNLNLFVGEKYNDTIFAEICKGEIYNQFGFNEIGQGLYTHSFLSQYGCDSIVNLSLLVYEPYCDTIYDTICNGDIYEYGFNADSSGTYIQNLNTQFGCDSILVLHLQVNPTFTDTIKGNIYKGNVYNKFGFNEKETGIYEQKLQTYLGCDSIIYLDLQVDNVLFPNVVTPNGDGVNDIFDIHNLIKQNAFPENELIIYNRQGRVVYKVKNIKTKSDLWDPKATSSSDGTYFYRFFGKRHDKVLEFNGSIEVMR
ncbi:hypothetical protein SDC9_15725 [bioreactor metagenome]|uniref:Uncharacterized protein n=1 Tax=bioreactor metagenome TaxID=1076179 RepID=A0A644TSP0_9ZZZZ